MRRANLAPVPRTSDAVSPYLLEPAVIPGLPPHLQTVPSELEAWLAWKTQVTAYRELVRRECEKDPRARAAEMQLCKKDPAYWMTMYAAIFEPRKYDDRRPGWYRWIPFAFQVQVIRAIEAAMETDELGRGDVVIEKSREMGISWTVCAYICHQFLFADTFVAGLVSRNAEQVDATGSTDTLFFKVRANLGLEPQVPANIGIPKWMVPKGLSREETVLRRITHPSKPNAILGETTTGMAGVGGRATLRFNDEAARFDDFDSAWPNQAATSFHRIAVSSADTKSPMFKQLSDLGRAAIRDPRIEAPTFLRLDWWINPYHTPQWYENEKARFKTDPHFFAREYEIDYHAGSGDTVYPAVAAFNPVKAPYDPFLGKLWCVIDPGTSDPAAIIWIQQDDRTNRYRVVESFEGRGGEDAEFIASVLVGVPISGYGAPDYGSYERLEEIMEWTGAMRRHIEYVGDPYGKAVMGDGKRSFFDALREKSRELTGGLHVINVMTITKAMENNKTMDARSHLARKNAVLKIVRRVDFHNNYGGTAVLTALKESRYPDRKEGRAYMSETLAPVHDEFSHRRTAFEFWAVWVTQRELVQAATQRTQGAAPVRISMSGRVVG